MKCPQCEKKLVFVPMYKSYYCNFCRKYMTGKISKWQTLKTFLKPTKVKIILFIFLFFCMFTNKIVVTSPNGKTFKDAPSLEFLLIFFSGIGDIFRTFSPSYIIQLILKQSYPICFTWCSLITFFSWYLIFCLIIWIYAKIRNRMLH